MARVTAKLIFNEETGIAFNLDQWILDIEPHIGAICPAIASKVKLQVDFESPPFPVMKKRRPPKLADYKVGPEQQRKYQEGINAHSNTLLTEMKMFDHLSARHACHSKVLNIIDSSLDQAFRDRLLVVSKSDKSDPLTGRLGAADALRQSNPVAFMREVIAVANGEVGVSPLVRFTAGIKALANICNVADGQNQPVVANKIKSILNLLVKDASALKTDPESFDRQCAYFFVNNLNNRDFESYKNQVRPHGMNEDTIYLYPKDADVARSMAAQMKSVVPKSPAVPQAPSSTNHNRGNALTGPVPSTKPCDICHRLNHSTAEHRDFRSNPPPAPRSPGKRDRQKYEEREGGRSRSKERSERKQHPDKSRTDSSRSSRGAPLAKGETSTQCYSREIDPEDFVPNGDYRGSFAGNNRSHSTPAPNRSRNLALDSGTQRCIVSDKDDVCDIRKKQTTLLTISGAKTLKEVGTDNLLKCDAVIDPSAGISLANFSHLEKEHDLCAVISSSDTVCARTGLPVKKTMGFDFKNRESGAIVSFRRETEGKDKDLFFIKDLPPSSRSLSATEGDLSDWSDDSGSDGDEEDSSGSEAGESNRE